MHKLKNHKLAVVKINDMNFDNYKVIPNYQTHKTDLFLAEEEDILACEKILNIVVLDKRGTTIVLMIL